MKCKKCGQVLGENDLVCPECGTKTERVVDSINDLFATDEQKEEKPKRNSRKRYNGVFAMAGAVAVIAFVVVLLVAGDAGKLRRARLFAYFKNYEMASRIADTCKREDNQSYKDYYIYLSYADRLLEEDNLAKYEDIITKMVDYDDEIDYSSLFVGDREKYAKISKAIKLRDGYDMEMLRQGILIPGLLEAQIKDFKGGSTFNLAEMKTKAQNWKDNFEKANKLYGDIMSTELPSYVNVLQEIEKMISNLNDYRSDDHSNIYFTKYNSTYKNPYTKQDVETLTENVQRQADYNCSKSICWALYNTERGVKIPQISEYKKATKNPIGEEQVTSEPTAEPVEQIEGYYVGFDNIPDFGYYFGMDPTSKKDFDYY